MAENGLYADRTISQLLEIEGLLTFLGLAASAQVAALSAFDYSKPVVVSKEDKPRNKTPHYGIA